MTGNNAITSVNTTITSAIEILSSSVSSRERKGCSCGPSTSVIVGISVSVALFLIAVAILVWFFRDYNEYLEETETRLKLKEDEKEANRNKKDPAKRKRAISATIEKQKLHVNESKKDDITETESSRSRSSSVNTNASYSSAGISIEDKQYHTYHDKECGDQQQDQTLHDHNTMINIKNNNDDNDDDNNSISTGQNDDPRIVSTETNHDNDHGDAESTTIVTTTITKAISAAVQAKVADTGRVGNEDDGDDYDNMCSICFEPFSDNEDLSWSKKNKCQHVFHSECLMTWLMKHEDCPICRTPLMTTQDFLDRTYADNTRDDEKKKMKKEGKSNYEIVSSDSNDGESQREQQNVTNEHGEEGDSEIQISIENDIESGAHNVHN